MFGLKILFEAEVSDRKSVEVGNTSQICKYRAAALRYALQEGIERKRSFSENFSFVFY